MPARVCAKCQAADNPLSRLRFARSKFDGKIYCENCWPSQEPVEAPPLPASAPQRKPSAGYAVIPCPECAGGFHRTEQICDACSGYCAVRMEVAMLNVYRPKRFKPPEILLEGQTPQQSPPSDSDGHTG